MEVGPPNPKALTPARRGAAVSACIQGRASVLMYSGLAERRAPGLGFETWIVGGSTL